MESVCCLNHCTIHGPWVYTPLYSPWPMEHLYHCAAHDSWEDPPLYNLWVMECIYHCTTLYNPWTMGYIYYCTAHGPWIHHCTIHDLWGGGTIVQPMVYGQPIPHGSQVVQWSDFHGSWAVQHHCTVNV